MNSRVSLKYGDGRKMESRVLHGKCVEQGMYNDVEWSLNVEKLWDYYRKNPEILKYENMLDEDYGFFRDRFRYVEEDKRHAAVFLRQDGRLYTLSYSGSDLNMTVTWMDNRLYADMFTRERLKMNTDGKLYFVEKIEVVS